ncbi:hypothetical protein KAT36_02535 [Candidatus Pacearchaeota archaeon]|nr:hypothetical protein [Candidatus Pacearchaeota archaeon]
MRIIILNYCDGSVYMGDVEDRKFGDYEPWLIEKGFNLNDIEWMVTWDSKIRNI